LAMEEPVRPGEIRSGIDPASLPGDARLVFIGRAETPWRERKDCPKNLREARERGQGATIVIDPPWRVGLQDVMPGAPIVVLSFFDRARRDILVQAPRHRPQPTGVFALRSPVRPNQIGLHIVRLLSIDIDAGRLAVDALDCLDGTPILDLKPWRSGIDIPVDPG